MDFVKSVMSKLYDVFSFISCMHKHTNAHTYQRIHVGLRDVQVKAGRAWFFLTWGLVFLPAFVYRTGCPNLSAVLGLKRLRQVGVHQNSWLFPFNTCAVKSAGSCVWSVQVNASCEK